MCTVLIVTPPPRRECSIKSLISSISPWLYKFGGGKMGNRQRFLHLETPQSASSSWGGTRWCGFAHERHTLKALPPTELRRYGSISSS